MMSTANNPSAPPASHIKIIEVHEYLPPGISRIIDRGGEHFIGVIDESTVLKYPSVPSNRESFRVEAQLLETLGSHPRVVAFKGLTEHGLALQYAPNGNLYNYMTSDPTLSLDKRIYWCKQAAEAVSYIHSKRVIHCDISPRNFLLDESFDLVLTDFQGMLKSVDGKTLLDGLSRECSKSFRPRIHGDYADVYTDIFALGSAIYFIMTGHEIFPDLNSFEDDEEILDRFKQGKFPTDEQEHICYYITDKCWKQHYQSAGDVVLDIIKIQEGIGKAHQDPA